MKKALSALSRLFKRAHPLPLLGAGFLAGLALAVFSACGTLPLTQLSFLSALPAILTVELPIWGLTALTGLTRLPSLTGLPLCWRAVLWGYGGLRLFASTGQSFLYFRYVIATGITLLPLCCIARLAYRTASAPGRLTGTAFSDYLCQCLFYLGLTLLTLPLRFVGGG